MGTYTELHFNSRLKRDTPKNVIDILKYMLGKKESPPALPEHPLFGTDGWHFMLTTDSYAFDADTLSTLRFGRNISYSYLLCWHQINNSMDIPREEKKKALEWIEQNLGKVYSDAVLETAFAWCDTPQKEKFWLKISELI